MNVIVVCECSGIVRDAFLKRGHNAISVDLKPTQRPGPHYRGDAIKFLDQYHTWADLMIAHPVCRRLANSGVRWLINKPPKGKNFVQVWCELFKGAEFYKKIRSYPINKKAIENPVIHCYAADLIGNVNRHIVQPHWFGEKAFKATGFELFNLPPLQRTHWMELPKKGTEEYKKWSFVHRIPPGPLREEKRSETFPCIAEAMAIQWGKS